jgi:hypothetical protein
MKDTSDDTLNFWREEGSLLIQKNFEEFHVLVAQAKKFMERGQYNAAAVYAEIAALHATGKHSGIFTSPQLEDVLLRIGHKVIEVSDNSSEWVSSPCFPQNILHVVTAVKGIGGLTKMIWRWISQDKDRSHSVVLTRQDAAKIPDALKEAVNASHGKIYILNERFDNFELIAQAKWLRELGSKVDLIVLHIHNFDVVPLIAFANRSKTPHILFLDHADHLFWLGAGISDIVISLRESGQRLAQEYRGISPDRSVLLPIIIDPPQRVFSRLEAKQKIGIPEDSILLLSIARSIKYKTIDGISFADAHIPLLRQHERAFLIVIGAGYRADWSNAIEQTHGRIIVYPEREDTAIFHQAADIYVDSFPFVSTTSTLEAAGYDVPLVSRFPYSDKSRIIGNDMPGLIDNLIRAKNLQEYTKKLSHLIIDQNFRLELGKATSQKVKEIHIESHWQNKLLEIYTYSTTISKVRPTQKPVDQINIDEPDIYIPFLHAWSDDFLDSTTQARLHKIPFLQRLQAWFKLVKKYGFRNRFMLLMPKRAQFIYGHFKMRCNYFEQLFKKTSVNSEKDEDPL